MIEVITGSQPVSFGSCAGIFNSGINDTGVLILGTWGFDELCSRKFLTALASMVSEQGFPVLRFDYPGCVDSLDLDQDIQLRDWKQSAKAAMATLRSLSGCRRLILVGFGLGGSLAMELCSDDNDGFTACVLLAPVVSGRRFIRELTLRNKVIYDGLGLPGSAMPEGCSIGGLELSESLADGIKKIRLDQQRAGPRAKCLIVAHAGDPAQQALYDHLKGLNCDAEMLRFEGFEALMENPTVSELPVRTLNEVASWIEQQPAQNAVAVLPKARPTEPYAGLTGADFIETRYFFGDHSPLYGVACKPQNTAAAPPVIVFINAGYDPHGGWARSTVENSRSLARQGIASFRFDMSNIGDSPPRPGAPEEVLYTDVQSEDLKTALEFTCKLFPDSPILLAGKCSGAYVAFDVAASYSAVRAAFLINQLVVVWDPENDIGEINRAGPRPLDEYRDRLTKGRLLQRLFRGDIDVFAALSGILSQAVDNASRNYMPKIAPFSKYARFRAHFKRKMQDIESRNVKLHIICSEKDQSRHEISYYFGDLNTIPERFTNVTFHTIENADHNITPKKARQDLLDILVKEARDLF
ncbi:alpha/beta fold hydrolase [Roseibium polysiphoniae]|uniref:alpha/beta fold hydrolase n=1 Tax=Roseibium polysiphoniae TaxID=2571221 RepID=UPI0032976031